jgi:hypothetical protein
MRTTELLYLLLDTRTANLATLLTTVELLGDQPLVPVYALDRGTSYPFSCKARTSG